MFRFSLKVLSETVFILRRICRDMIKNVLFCNFVKGTYKIGKTFTDSVGASGEICFFQVILKIN